MPQRASKTKTRRAAQPAGTLLGIVAVLGAAALWGTTGTVATFAPEVGPLAIGAAALGIGGLLQALIALPALFRARAALSAHIGSVIAGAIGVFIYPLAFYSSMHFAGVAVGTVVSLGSAPIASGVLERVTTGKKLSRWWMLAVALGIAGSTILAVAKVHDAPSEIGPTITGIVVGLLAGATYALYSFSAHKLMRRGIGRAVVMGAIFGLGGLLLMPVLVLTGEPLVASTRAFAVGAYMALIPMFIGYVLFGYGLMRVTASTATTLTLAEPAIAALLAVAIVGERLAPIGWVGMAAICVSLLVLSLGPATRKVETHRAKPRRAESDKAPGHGPVQGPADLG